MHGQTRSNSSAGRTRRNPEGSVAYARVNRCKNVKSATINEKDTRRTRRQCIQYYPAGQNLCPLQDNDTGGQIVSENITLSVPGMKCGGCVASVEKALMNHAGVRKVDVDLDSKTARIEADVPPSDLVAAVKAAGYEAEAVD